MLLPTFQVQDEPLSIQELKKLIEGLGHKTTMLSETLGREKFEFKVREGSFDVPITVELSPDKAYVRFQALLVVGPAPNDAAKLNALLKANEKITPNAFYLDQSGALKIGLGLDNHGITAPLARRATDGLAQAVVQTEGIW